MSTLVIKTVESMIRTGDLAPAARAMGTEALRQWATLHGVESYDAAYIMGAAYVRTVWPHDVGDPLSGEWVDEPTAREVSAMVTAATGESDEEGWSHADAWEAGYCDESNRLDHGTQSESMAELLDMIIGGRRAAGIGPDHDEDDAPDVADVVADADAVADAGPMFAVVAPDADGRRVRIGAGDGEGTHVTVFADALTVVSAAMPPAARAALADILDVNDDDEIMTSAGVDAAGLTFLRAIGGAR